MKEFTIEWDSAKKITEHELTELTKYEDAFAIFKPSYEENELHARFYLSWGEDLEEERPEVACGYRGCVSCAISEGQSTLKILSWSVTEIALKNNELKVVFYSCEDDFPQTDFADTLEEIKRNRDNKSRSRKALQFGLPQRSFSYYSMTPREKWTRAEKIIYAIYVSTLISIPGALLIFLFIPTLRKRLVTGLIIGIAYFIIATLGLGIASNRSETLKNSWKDAKKE